MLDNESLQIALRTRALTLAPATTGSVTLAATLTGYTRSSGSFITDGLWLGMEITPSGFASNPVSTITAIAALAITVKDARTAEIASAGRTLAVLFPSQRAFENVELIAATGAPYVEEHYLPGPVSLDSLGAQGDMTVEPMYVLNVYVPSQTGTKASNKYTDALLTLFSPSTSFAAGSDTVFVRADVAPYKGQRSNAVPGFSVVTVTIPLRCFTRNA